MSDRDFERTVFGMRVIVDPNLPVPFVIVPPDHFWDSYEERVCRARVLHQLVERIDLPESDL